MLKIATGKSSIVSQSVLNEANILIQTILNNLNENDLIEIILTYELGIEISNMMYTCKEYPNTLMKCLITSDYIFKTTKTTEYSKEANPCN